MVARRIKQEEAESFLRLLCDVFGLDLSRAKSIFFNEPLFDINRKWALFDGDRMVSILTTVPLEFGWGRAIGVAGVATALDCQGRGCAGQLLERVIETAEAEGEGSVLLFARELGLYTRVGFKELDHIVRGEILDAVEDPIGPVLEYHEVRDLYTAWSLADPARLRRDEQRWKYWRWTLRMCSPVTPRGYVCMEGHIVRECVTHNPQPTWPVGAGAEWFGASELADRIGLRLRKREFDLYFMGYNIPMQPQMFMTDQF